MTTEKVIEHRELIGIYSKRNGLSWNDACAYIGDEMWSGKHNIENVTECSEWIEEFSEYTIKGWLFLKEFMIENNLKIVVIV